MKLKKVSTLAAVCVCGALMFSGCSFSSVMDKILGRTEEVVENEEEPVEKDVRQVDDTLEKPAFTVSPQGSVQFPVGSEASPISAEASVGDGGTVTYQWYYNNVNVNGGGEKMEGQTENTCIPDTSTVGTYYYYVVATNNKEDRIAMSVSTTVEVQIVPEGSWVDENNMKRYQLYDGTYVTNTWKDIDGQRYCFDENGYMRSNQWFQDVDGSWYYLNPDGTMARDTEIDGYAVDSEGRSEAKKNAMSGGGQPADGSGTVQ